LLGLVYEASGSPLAAAAVLAAQALPALLLAPVTGVVADRFDHSGPKSNSGQNGEPLA